MDEKERDTIGESARQYHMYPLVKRVECRERRTDGGKKGPKRPQFECENPAIDELFLAVDEATKEAAINALSATRANASLDGHRVEALPVDAIGN